jgi:hypothetical protein
MLENPGATVDPLDLSHRQPARHLYAVAVVKIMVVLICPDSNLGALLNSVC